MSGFLHRLAARTIGVAPVAQPVVPAMFTPDSNLEGSASRAAFLAESPITTSVEKIPSDNLSQLTLPKLSKEPPFISSAENEPQPRRDSRLTSNPWPEPPDQDDLTLPAITKRSMTFALPNHREETQALVETADVLPQRARMESLHPMTDQKERGIPGSHIRPVTQANRRSILSERDRSSDDGSQSPIIRVTIGRIDVRAQFPAHSPAVSATQPRKTAALSLDEYMKQRSEGKR